jgi:hypothetical protein
MSNLIQIKRSLNTSTPTSLANGELAYSANGEQLFIGSPDGGAVTAIGGAQFSYLQQSNTDAGEGGTLTANAVIITDANSFVNKVYTSELVINTSGNTSVYIDGIITDGSLTSASNNDLATAWAIKDYVDNNSAAKFKDLDDVNVSGVSNNGIIVFNESSNTFEDHTISGSANEVEVSFNNQDITIGLPDDVVIANTFKAGANALFVNSSTVAVTSGNKLTLGGTVVGSIIPDVDSTYNLGNSSFSFNTLFVNNIVGSITSESLTGNTLNVDGNASIGSSLVDLINIVGAIGTTLTPNGNGTIDLGSSDNYWDTLFSREIDANNIVSTGLANVANLNVGTIDRNPTVTVTLEGDVTGTASATLTNLANGTVTITTAVAANSVVLGTDTTGDYVESVTAGDGISVTSGTGEGSTPTINVIGNTGVTSNSSGVFIGQAVGTTDDVTFANVVASTQLSSGSNNLFVNTSSVYISSNLHVASDILPTTNNTVNLGSNVLRFGELFLAGNSIILGDTTLSDDSGTLKVNNATVDINFTVSGNTSLGTDSNDVVSFNAHVNTSIIPSSNVSYDLGTSSLRFANVYANDVITFAAKVGVGGLTVDGDLVVTGNLTSIDVNTLKVEDPLLHLASNNETSDAVDIGFIGHYSDDGGNSHRHTGLFRDATVGKFFIFDNYIDVALDTGTSNIIDVTDSTFRIATLNAYLESGGLTSNSSAVNITANSSVSSAIVANTLTLSTALGVSSGGTGNQTFTNNAVLFGYGTGAIQQASGANGQVLQIVNDVPTFGSLDGGSF